jgi:predicted nucleotidyltransferase
VSQPELLRRVVEALESAGIGYMVTGSVASSLQGEPRATHDIDIVIEVAAHQLRELLRSFPRPDFYVSEEAAREALQTGGMFNVLDTVEGDKVDFWLLTDDSFDQMRFSRKYVEEVFGIHLSVTSPEDTILQKLRWVNLSGGSGKAFMDALRVYEVQQGALDLQYMDDWVSRIGVEDLWARVKAEAEPI